MSQDEFAKFLGTSKQNISRYENGSVSPKVSTAQGIANKLGVSLTELNGGDSVSDNAFTPLTPAERRLVERYRELNAEGQARLLDEADLLCSALRYQKDSVPSASSDAG